MAKKKRTTKKKSAKKKTTRRKAPAKKRTTKPKTAKPAMVIKPMAVKCEPECHVGWGLFLIVYGLIWISMAKGWFWGQYEIVMLPLLVVLVGLKMLFK